MTRTVSRAMRVLVVEDELAHQDLVRERLDAYEGRFELEFVGTCREAVERLSASAYDCVVLDHNLPDGTGAELLITARFQLLTTPVVSFSTSIDPDVVLSDFRGGCVEFVPKREAFRGEVLGRAIVQGIKRYRTRAVVERSGSSVELVRRAAELIAFDGYEDSHTDRNIEDAIELIYETAIKTIKDGVLLIERRSRVIYANPGFKLLLGIATVDDLPGYPLTTIDDIFSAESVGAMRESPSERELYEGALMSPSGREIPVQISESPIGEHGTLLAITDLREIKEQQHLLEEQNRRLADLNEMANRFVDNVSHEFRTPLAVIKGYAEIISERLAGPVSDQQQEHLQTIIDRTRDLAQMVDDLLDSSKLRAKRLRVDRRACTIESIIDPVRDAIEQKSRANKITIVEDLAAGLPVVYADAEKAGRVITNLVVNAIKFSDEGGTVSVWARPSLDGGIDFGVTDTGPGISEESLQLIFDRFQQVGGTQRSSTKGFGLGLNIASELVAMNLGRMSVQSEMGKGSTFGFDLPPADPAAAALRLLTQMQDRTEGPVSIALLEVRTRSGVPCPDKLRGFVASSIYPMDLILDGTDDAGLLLFGLSTCPERWGDRLRVECDRVAAEFETDDWAVDVRVVQTWAYIQDAYLGASDTLASRCTAWEGGATCRTTS